MINELKDLKQLFKLCRQQGVTEIKLSGVEIKFGDMPLESKSGSLIDSTQDEASPYANFPQGDLKPEQLIFYSSGGLPENDPSLKDVVNQ